METVAIITNLLLAGLTAVYVILTQRLLRVNIEANRQNRDFSIENHRLQVYPQIFCHVEKKGSDAFYLVLQNLGDNSATDVDILSIVVYSSEALAPERFRDEFVAEYHGEKPEITLTDEGFFGIYDHVVYFTAPPYSKTEARRNYPILPDSIYVLIQFRDVLGNNYYRYHWIFYEGDRYKIGSIDPISAQTISRLSFERQGKKTVLRSESGGSLPTELKNFLDLWENSIPSGYILGMPRNVEEPSKWKKI